MYEVSNIFFTALEGFIFLIAFISLSDRRDFLFEHLNRVVIFVAIYTIYTLFLTGIFPTGLQTLPLMLLNSVVFNYMFNGTYLKSLIKQFITVIFFIFVELFIITFTTIVLKVPMDSTVNTGYTNFICTIVSKSFESAVILILYKSNIRINFLIDRDYHRSKFAPILMLIASALLLLIGLNVYVSGDPNKLVLFNIGSFIIYAVLIVAVAFMFREFSKLEMLEFASELEKENIQQLIEFNEMVAKERHEYKNHLNTIYGLCTLNKPDLNEKIKLYINNYANTNVTRNIAIESGNDYVDAIVNVKYNSAIRKGINVSVDFDAPLSFAKIDEDVAVTVISNIIENALESIVPIQKENKHIDIKSYINGNAYYIAISNNGPMITEADKKKIFNAGFSTKDNTSKKRGFGLNIVLSEVERSGGKITINSTEEVTEFLVALKLSSQQAVAKIS